MKLVAAIWQLVLLCLYNDWNLLDGTKKQDFTQKADRPDLFIYFVLNWTCTVPDAFMRYLDQFLLSLQLIHSLDLL